MAPLSRKKYWQNDEKYMPPEMAEKVKKEHDGKLPVAKPQ
jgi:cytochrome c-type biogenesis protein CcmE